MKIGLSHIALLLLLMACNRHPAVSILPREVRLKAGDVVFRRGNSLESHAVLMADDKGYYSHVGIVVDSAGVPMIAHAVPGEPDYDGDPDRVKLDTPQRFFMSSRAEAGEVRRYVGDSRVAAVAAQVALATYQRGTLFDHDYDAADTTSMYCTELVEHAYRAAGVSLSQGRRHRVAAPGIGRRTLMLPSDVLNQRLTRRVAAFVEP